MAASPTAEKVSGLSAMLHGLSAMLNGWSDIALLGLGALSICMLSVSIIAVRRDQQHHVHTVWYIFSLTLCLMLALDLYIYVSFITERRSSFGQAAGDIIIFVFNSSTKVSEEIYILIFIFWILIVPQTLSYIISGIFGCGSRPILISQITAFVIWSLIKSLSVVSGILAALSVFALYGEPYLRPKDSLPLLIKALISISMSFSIMAIYYKMENVFGFIIKHQRLRFASSVHNFLTRCRK